MSHRNHRRKKRARQPYRGSRAFDATCRNHGGCDYCRDGRLHAQKRMKERAEAE